MTSKCDFELSRKEAEMFRYMDGVLSAAGYHYLAVNSLVRLETLERQGLSSTYIQSVPGTSEPLALAGSAEQGILEYFADSVVEQPLKLYAYNHCFRNEDRYLPYLRLNEFRKMEQYVFTRPEQWLMDFDETLGHVTQFLNRFDIEYRVVNCTERDSGYHRHKVDVEINTPLYGWVESHSLTYFGTEQSQRFGITDAGGEYWHTISATAIAAPRILLPFILKPEGY